MTDTCLEKYLQLISKEPSLFGRDDDPISILKTRDEIERVQAVLSEQSNQVGKNDHAKLGVIHDGYFFRVLRDPVKFPSGDLGGYLRILNAQDRPKGVVVIAYKDGEIALIKQFRHSVRGWRWEAPRGFAESGETTIETAHREMLEETGYSIENCKVLGEIEPDTGLTATSCFVVSSTISLHENMPITDPSEAIQSVQLFTPSEVNDLVLSGQLTDGLTLAALRIRECFNFEPDFETTTNSG